MEGMVMEEGTVKQKVGRRIWFFLLLGISGYYIWRLFALAPWYDELYTYHYFISRGPIYAAIHWPLPNNHFLYSILSAFMDYLGVPLLGLRGISLVCAVANLILLSFLAKNLLGEQYCIPVVCLYAGMDSVNYLAVQGRGYTLATTLYLISLCCLYHICISESVKKKYYIVYSIALTAGLYTLPSSVYWVVPTCIAGGFILLLSKKGKILLRLIVASIIAAINTFIIYSAVWLAIGSNLLQDDPSKTTYGESHLKILLSEPLHSWICGRDFMAGSSYVQSEATMRDMIVSFVPYWSNIFNGFYAHLAYGFFTVFLLTLLFTAVYVLRRHKQTGQALFLSVFLSCTIILIALMMFLQGAVPYERVYSFVGVPSALSIVFCVNVGLGFLQEKGKETVLAFFGIFGIVMLIFCLGSAQYNRAYAGRETQIWELIRQENIPEDCCFFLTDSYQELLLHFYYGDYREVSSVEEADVLMMPLESLENMDMVGWPVFYPYNYFDWPYIEREFDITYENDGYLLYRRKQ